MHLCRHGLLCNKIYHVLCVTTVTLYSLALACVSTSPHKNKRFVLASCTALLLFLFITKLGRDNISNITNNVSIKKKKSYHFWFLLSGQNFVSPLFTSTNSSTTLDKLHKVGFWGK